MTSVNIVSFCANIAKIGTRSCQWRFTESKPDQESHLDV